MEKKILCLPAPAVGIVFLVSCVIKETPLQNVDSPSSSSTLQKNTLLNPAGMRLYFFK